jgi:integrase
VSWIPRHGGGPDPGVESAHQAKAPALPKQPGARQQGGSPDAIPTLLPRPVTIGRAIDLYIGELARHGRARTTRETYERLLNDLADTLPYTDFLVTELRREHYERFLNRWVDSESSTLASGVSLCHGFSTFLYERRYTERDEAHDIKRPRRKKPEDLDVVTVSTQDVMRMIDACEDWQELLCVTTAAYLGPRRAALSRARRRDVDLDRGVVRFREKGGKVTLKPIPDEYLAILRAAEENGVWTGPEDYLIPNRRPASVRRSERSDKIIWNTIKRVAARAGVRAHVHALRAAFAVQFDEAHPDRIHALKELMGHARLETTLIYLRRKNRAKDMEAVRDLSWGSSVFPSFAEEAHTGFEPVPPP